MFCCQCYATLLPLGNQAHHVLPVLGLRPALSLTPWGAETPPASSSHAHIISRLWPLPFSPLRGFCQSVNFPHSTCGAPFSTLNSPTHSRGGRGAGHALPYPPHPPPPLARSLGLGGGGTHQSGSPLFLSGWRGSFGPPPCPVWGLAVSTLALPSLTRLLSPVKFHLSNS